MARKKKIDKEMGFRLKQARTEQKLTYEELAEKSGVSSRYIKEIENHGNVPSLEKLGQLIRALHISADPFFIQLSRQTTSTTSGCWFICHNVQKNRLQQFSLLWKPIFGHIKIFQSKSTPSPISFLKQGRLPLAA